MYETFYKLREKPFTLLPDPGFLYPSKQHRMAMTLLEYGLVNQAGFIVISGEIGAGKTTLIRQLLNNMGQEYTIGLITNTHRSFGELLQWILLAFNLDHKDMSKVEMHQRFVEFIIDEYAQNRHTVLIVDEAQNMDAETLEELRMLSNINADKDLSLQVVLSGQRELRETLRRPDLVQFAQRITVDYHLEPLSESDTAGYIRHRLQVAGGDPDTFTPRACAAIHRYSGGIPRLINLLCDISLVYGYADQKRRIDAKLVTDVAREKQQSGIFPVHAPAEVSEEDLADEREVAAAAAQQPPAEPVAPESAAAEERPDDAMSAQPAQAGTETLLADERGDNPAATTYRVQDYAAVEPYAQPAKKKLRLALCARGKSRRFLSELLEDYGFKIVDTFSPDDDLVAKLDPRLIDVLLIDALEDAQDSSPALNALLASWPRPVLYNDAINTRTSQLRGRKEALGRALTQRIYALADRHDRDPAAVNQ
ncbi:MAG: tRNA (adenosine(37)-N6)-threonylcarbamoyltransferase complex ATPase subunit type 1 TsaE [Gammaproteobacteria bacterium]